MSGSSVGYRPSSGYRRGNLVHSLGSSVDGGGYVSSQGSGGFTSSSHREGSGYVSSHSSGGYTSSSHRDGGGYVNSGGGYMSSSHRDGGGYVSSQSSGGYRPSSSSSARYSNTSVDYGSSLSSSPSPYSQNISSGYVSDSSYNSGMSRAGTGAGIYASSPYADASYQSGQMMRAGQRGVHLSPSTTTMGGERSDDGLFPTPRLPITTTMSGGERKRGRNSVDIIGAVTQLSQMGNPESKLALNILNSVLGGSEEEDISSFGVSPPNKMMCMDMDEGHGIRRGQIHSPSLPVHNPLQRDYQYQPPLIPSLLDQIQQSNSSYSHDSYDSTGHHMMANDPYRRPVMPRLGRPQPGTRNYRDYGNNQQKGRSGSSGAARRGRTPDGQRASVGPRQRDSRSDQSTGPRKDKHTGQNSFEDYPVEALKCFMCKVDKYHFCNEYLFHLQRKEHIMSSKAYHNHGDEVFNLLKINAKLISERQIAEAQAGTEKVVTSRCTRCQCKIVGSMNAHMASCEHIVMDRFMKYRCCQHPFTNRLQLEEHRLSTEHLKNKYKKMKMQQSKESESANMKEDEKPASKDKDKEPANKEDKELVGKEGDKESATKEEDKESATKEEEKEFATKEEEKESATKEEDKEPATKEEEKESATKEEDKEPATKEEKKDSATKEEEPALKEGNKEPANKKENKESANEEEGMEPAILEEIKEMVTEEGLSEEEAMKMFKDAAKEFQANGEKEMYTATTFPPYDPTKPIGLHRLAVFSDYRCEACPTAKLRMHTNTVLAHFQSITHYMNIFDHVANIKNKKRKSSKEEEWENENLEDNAKERKCASGFSNADTKESGGVDAVDTTTMETKKVMETEKVKEGDKAKEDSSKGKRKVPHNDSSKEKKEETPSKVTKPSQNESCTVKEHPKKDSSTVKKQEPPKHSSKLIKQEVGRKDSCEVKEKLEESSTQEKLLASNEIIGQNGNKIKQEIIDEDTLQETEEVQEAKGKIQEAASNSEEEQQEKNEVQDSGEEQQKDINGSSDVDMNQVADLHEGHDNEDE